MNRIATSGSVVSTFSRVHQAWLAVESQLDGLYEEARTTLGDDLLHGDGTDFSGHLSSFKKAMLELEECVERPKVIVATTGTTSSGKSTLANYLIGAPLIPKAVQEMSLGVVTVHHSDVDRTLVVEETKNARWECGSWELSEARDARRRLEHTMNQYRMALEKDGQEIDPPRFHLRWPTRFGETLKEQGLPLNADVQIDDLPGLKHLKDEHNRSLIVERARNALCLVAYNAFETDPVKQDFLINQVVGQVKQLGGSPRRMLFILNRFDAFMSDESPVESGDAYYADVKNKIQKALLNELPEYTDAIQNIKPLRLSSEPALFGLMAQQSKDEERANHLYEIVKSYEQLFTRQEMRHLPRDERDWSAEQQEWFIRETMMRSHGAQFVETLQTHIRKNLPELVLPNVISKLYSAASSVLLHLDAIAVAYNESEETALEAAIGRLDENHDTLQSIRKEVVGLLDPIKNTGKKNGENDYIAALFEAIPTIERELGLKRDEMAAIHQFLPATLDQPFTALAYDVLKLMEGDGELSVLTENSPLYRATISLKGSQYGRNWQTGGQFTHAKKAAVISAIQSFTTAFADELSASIRAEAVRQSARLEHAFDQYAQGMMQQIETRASKRISDFQFEGMLSGMYTPVRYTPPSISNITFNPDFRTYSYNENVRYMKTQQRQRRVWWTLWLLSETVTEQVPCMRVVQREGIEISGLNSILGGLLHTGDFQRLENDLHQWMTQTIDVFDEHLQKSLQAGFKQYRMVLRRRQEELKQDAHQRISLAKEFAANVKGVRERVDTLRTLER